jgi:hypothetical protein
MSLADAIRKATSKTVPDVIEGMAKSTVTTTRYTKGRDSAARPTNTPSHPITAKRWWIREVGQAHVQRVWGQTADVQAQTTVRLGTDVADNDVVQVTAGDFAGNVYEIKQMIRQPNANKIDIALGPTGQKPAP